MTQSVLPFEPLVIIGAGRSGTNILRDTLCRLPGFATWPCDEINPIWRHGNLGMAHDEFGAEHARPGVKAFIRGAFAREWRRGGQPRFLVEKTCASSLRVPFIAAVLPEARFIYIVRNGGDVVASAGKRWKGELEVAGLPYFWSKIRFTPLRDLPVYGWRFLSSRLGMMAGRAQRLSSWGPTSRAMLALPADTPLDQLCAIQWRDCVGASDAGLAALPADRWLAVRYEDLVADPGAAVRQITDFLQLVVDNDAVAAAIAPVSRKSVGKGAHVLDQGGPEIRAILAPALSRHGYV